MKWLFSRSVLLLSITVALAQTGPPQISFEVASVKAAPAMNFRDILAQRLMGVTIDAAQARFHRQTVAALVARAYRVGDFQISDPGKQAEAEYDIAAKLPDGSTVEQVPEMLQSLLADRFKLAIHRESRNFDVYVLSVGKDGPTFPKGEDDQDRPVTMESLALRASATLSRPVLDQTGLKGEYKIRVNALTREVAEKLHAVDRGESDDRGVSVVVQFIHKLGLQIEARKMPLPVMVIDHVEKTPVEN